MPRILMLPLTVVSLMLVAAVVRAEIVTPDGLVAGDKFRVVFVSSDARDATSSDITEYDSFVANAANNAGLTYNGNSVDWHAIGSTPTVNAFDFGRFSGNNLSSAIFRLDGAQVLSSGTGMWGRVLDVTISLDENGDSFDGFAWTGTASNGNGTGGDTLLGGTGDITLGDTTRMDGFWVNGSSAGGGTAHRLYAISNELTAVPEPSSLFYFGLGLGLLARRKRFAQM